VGTNFYWRYSGQFYIATPEEDVDVCEFLNEDDPRIHIGKRSFAGKYCWECMRTLCESESLIHSCDGEWCEICPDCMSKKNVDGACSFSWAQLPSKVIEFCQEHPYEEIMEDECGRPLTGEEFVDMLFKYCPIWIYSFISQEFS